MSDNAAVVIDNGSGYTKIGFAGSSEPLDVFHSAINRPDRKESLYQLDDLHYEIVDKGFTPNQYSNITYPIKHGRIEDWDSMISIWNACIYEKLRCIPEDHPFLLTESSMSLPESREQISEIFFESFNIKALCIAVQPVLALIASWTNSNVDRHGLSGIVVDSGYSNTSIVPVYDGQVLKNNIQQIHVGSRDAIVYIQDLMRDRKETIPPGMRMEVAKDVKERLCYSSLDIQVELERYDSNPDKYIKIYEGVYKTTSQKWTCNVGYEQFLAPEVILTPEICGKRLYPKLDEAIDNAISSCPIDTRKELYQNIILSGGGTQFPNFDRRLQRDVQMRLNDRLHTINNEHTDEDFISKDINVKVIGNNQAALSTWLGGSIFASMKSFESHCLTKEQYEEEGARSIRQNMPLRF